MSVSKTPTLGLSALAAFLLPVGLWAMLWLSLHGGSISDIANPGSTVAFVHGLRAVFPFIAASVAMAMILLRLSRFRRRRFVFLGPLGLTALYGLVGVLASLKSPQATISLYWAASYLSVPIVLWGVAWGPDLLDHLRRIVILTWLGIVLIVALLFTAALLYLQIGTIILAPSEWFDCDLHAAYRGASWLDLTWGIIRPTGIGRYAAIASIVALSGLWQPRWRFLWGIVLLISLILLLTSGARSSIVGLGAGLAVVFLLSGSKKTALAGAVVLGVLLPSMWFTGIHREFLDNCIFRGQTPTILAGPTARQPEVTPAITAEPSTLSQLPVLALEQGSNQSQAAVEELNQRVGFPVDEAPSTVPPPDAGIDQPDSATEMGQAGLDGSVVSTTKEPLDSTPPESATPEQSLSETSSPDLPAQPVAELTEPKTSPLKESADSTPPQPLQQVAVLDEPKTTAFPDGFLTFSGRTAVWAGGVRLIRQSPLIGYGFHADRLLLGAHMHNSLLHAMIQTGMIGGLVFAAAMVYAWAMLYGLVRNLASYSSAHKPLIIQSGGVLAFLSLRSLFESSGAFFGVDWLVLAPILLYLQAMNQVSIGPENADFTHRSSGIH